MDNTTMTAQWHAEHVGFSRLLDLLEDQLARFREGESPDLPLMLEIVSYLREYGDSFHHPREDAAFECLVARDPTLRLPINRLLQEHRVIAFAGDELAARLNQVIGDAVVLRATVEAAAALYLAYYRNHLSTEERLILPRAAVLLTEQDRETVARAAPAGPDPLFGAAPTATYRRLRELMAARPEDGAHRD
ncbi:hemerythrin domain-containing protein [Variovorax defluvii]|uniref:Hemerythrin domain-containing protein n=1 Tax=Variovorax defluvii TaxID=913761 RepID=A0ABP8HW86_9BURK